MKQWLVTLNSEEREKFEEQLRTLGGKPSGRPAIPMGKDELVVYVDADDDVATSLRKSTVVKSIDPLSSPEKH